ncbi:PA3496 family putative envelope integrity protein [Pseudomonas sp. NPDC007930]|uniref:PA3496 family putative envelope integrity protein n=1 Tax=Pseudomonas sp. NPDC007930 TaxID=3364417 RepID=UPI0036E0F842
MARSFEGPATSKTRRQQEDARRMAFRRAIECREDERRLLSEISDYPDAALWQAPAMPGWQNAQPGY